MRNPLDVFRKKPAPAGTAAAQARPVAARRLRVQEFDLGDDDPLLACLMDSHGVVEVEALDIDSPGLRALRSAGIRLTVPLISQGELIGLLNLGRRLSEQGYTGDDLRLIAALAAQAAPALRAAQLARLQQAQARERERMEQELRVARIIQQTLLPRQLPDPPGWKIAAHWQPARAVGGDFYDFVSLDDGRLVLFVGDVTDKGVPAALVMATTRGLLRSAAERHSSPGKILERANELLCPDIPPQMFVTCLCAILDTRSGEMIYANAGHNPPYLSTPGGLIELRATGMPLGLLPGMSYDEKSAQVQPGGRLLIYSDGLVEAHNPAGEIYSFPRLRRLLSEADDPPGAAADWITLVLTSLAYHTGAAWEQEDDVTLMSIERQPAGLLGEFEIPAEPGNERLAVEKVLTLIAPLDLPPRQVERLKTAVAEAAMNAMEHGNHYQADLPVEISVSAGESALTVKITDQGGGQPIPDTPEPDLEAKLDGRQSPRGWGLFLIRNMVDELHTLSDEVHHTIEMVFYLNRPAPAADGPETGGEA